MNAEEIFYTILLINLRYIRLNSAPVLRPKALPLTSVMDIVKDVKVVIFYKLLFLKMAFTFELSFISKLI